MKLKAINYALGYGKSMESLVRSEGARRVKLAIKRGYERSREKNLLYPFRYGGGSLPIQTVNHERIRQSFENGDKIGVQFLECDFLEIEERIAATVGIKKARQQSMPETFRVKFGTGSKTLQEIIREADKNWEICR